MWRRPLSWVGAALCTPGALRSVRGLLRPVRARFGSPVPAPPGLSLDDRLQRRLHGGAPGQAAGPLLSLPLPHHHELHADLPQGTARGPPAWAPGAECAAQRGPRGQSAQPPQRGPGGVGVRRVPWARTRVPALGSAGLALAAGTTGRKHPSTGGRGGCSPAGPRAPPAALCPTAGLRALCVCSRPRGSAQLSPPLSAAAPGLTLPQPQQLPGSSFLGLRSLEGGLWPSSALLAQPTSESASSCGPARGRGATRTALCAGLWMEQCCFRGQAARWKTHTQPVSRLKKKRHHISAVVKSRLGHGAVCPAGVGPGVSGAAGCCRPQAALPALTQAPPSEPCGPEAAHAADLLRTGPGTE